MISESEIKALISLLDDTDDEVVSQVEKRLFQLGPDVIPSLEQPWDMGDVNELRQRRLDEIIKRIQSQSLTSELRNWKQYKVNNLLEGVLLINRVKYSDVDHQFIDNLIDKIKLDVWLEMHYDLTSFEKIKILNYVFFDVHKFVGDNEDYHNPDNSYLSRVFERKKGNPISLAIIYSLVAQRLRLPVFGINLPQHFIVGYLENYNDTEPLRLNDSKIMIPEPNARVQFYINPFNKGSIFPRENLYVFLKQVNIEPREEYFLPCTNIEILKRMVRNLISAYEKLKNPAMIHQYEAMMAVLDEA
ncbi:MAG: transglutaminase-like domain-containing protein [Bacteroidia bacterium]